MDDEMKRRVSFFNVNYEIISGGQLGKGTKIFIKPSKDKNGNKICKFCGKTEPFISFKNISHAVPMFLGNRILIAENECDSCNEKFSNDLENNLDKFTKPYRTLANIRGRAKVPTYKSKDKRTRLEYNLTDGMNITSHENEVNRILDIKNKTLKYSFDLEPYVPTAVYKCLVKIALSVMPKEEMKNFTESLAWIMNEDHSIKLINPQILLSMFIPGFNPNITTLIFLLKRKNNNNEIPYCYLVLGFGNVVYQIMVPAFSDISHGNKTTLTFTRFPTPFESEWSLGKPVYISDDLSSHEVCSNKNLPLTFVFEDAKEIK